MEGGKSFIPTILAPAPCFKGMAVDRGEYKEICLDDYKGSFLVIIFYPSDFTYVCPTELVAFSSRMSEFEAVQCKVLAVSCDSEFCHMAWVQTPRVRGGLEEMNIPLLSDKSSEMARNYGVYDQNESAARRAMFIIDEQQRVRQVTINDAVVGRSVDEALRLVMAFKQADVSGDVCPMGWRPGDKTITPDPICSLEYFNELYQRGITTSKVEGRPIQN